MNKVLLYIVIISTNLFAQNYLQNQIGEADYLFNTGKYFDAITEYKRLKFFDSQNTYSQETNYKIGICYKEGAKFDDAIKYFVLAEDAAVKNDDIYEIKTQIIRSNILRRTTNRAHQLLDELESDYRFTDKLNDINYWRGWTYIFADEWNEAAETFAKINTNHQLKMFAEEVHSKKYSVSFAKILSYLLPGTGQIYTGNFFAGLLSMGWNVLWGYLTIDAWSNNRMFDGFAVGSLLWLRFYRGSAQNAEKYAVENNIEIANETLRYLQKSYEGLKP